MFSFFEQMNFVADKIFEIIWQVKKIVVKFRLSESSMKNEVHQNSI